MKNPTIKDRIKQLEGYATSLASAARLMDQRRGLLEPLINNLPIKESLKSLFKDRFGAIGYNQIAPTLAQDLVRDLVRLVLDDDRKSASLVNIFRKANESKLKSELRKKFSDAPLNWSFTNLEGLSDEMAQNIEAQVREKDRQEYEKNFDDTWDEVERAVQSLGADQVALRIMSFRNKYLAHLEMNPLGQEPKPFDVSSLGLTFNEILEFCEKYFLIIFEFVRIITGASYAPDEIRTQHSEYGKEMWELLAGVDVTTKL